MATDTEQPLTDHDRLEAWRLEQLLQAGYAPFRADLIAARDDIDLHQAVELVKNGCPQRLALKILL